MIDNSALFAGLNFVQFRFENIVHRLANEGDGLLATPKVRVIQNAVDRQSSGRIAVQHPFNEIDGTRIVQLLFRQMQESEKNAETQ